MIENIGHKKKYYAGLNECQKRQYLGMLAIDIGLHGVSEVSEAFGVHRHTIRTGKKEVLNPNTEQTNNDGIRKSGAGRKKI